MRTSLAFSSTILAATLALFVVPACGDGDGSSGNGGAGNAGGTGGTGGTGGSGGGTPGPCVAVGKWQITYEANANQCVPTADTMTVTQNPADGTLSVAFEGDDTMPMDTCNPMSPTPPTYTTSASVSMDGCTLTAGSDASYCFSGENQCEERALTLQITDDDASGTLVYSNCWCPSPGSPPVTLKATAKRVP